MWGRRARPLLAPRGVGSAGEVCGRRRAGVRGVHGSEDFYGRFRHVSATIGAHASLVAAAVQHSAASGAAAGQRYVMWRWTWYNARTGQDVGVSEEVFATQEQALQAAFAWQDEHMEYAVDVIEAETR